MVQVMGNRILGGIGAPSGAGMAESFGAGVNTALNQRTSRQNMEQTAQTMRINDQKMKWAEEDRKRAQAAAAAAASARAQSIAATKAIAAGLKPAALSVSVPAGKTYGPGLTTGSAANLLPPNTTGGGATPAAPTATRPALSFGASGGVSGGAGAAGLRGGPGTDDLTSKITNIQSVQGTLPAGVQPQGRPGNFAAQATARDLQRAPTYNEYVRRAQAGVPITVEQLVKSVDAGLLTTQQALDVQSMIESGYIPDAASIAAANAAGVTPSREYAPTATQAAIADWVGGVAGRTRGEQAAIEAERARLRGEPPPTDIPLDEIVVNQPTPPGGYSMGTEAAGAPVTPTSLSFGPKLGAAPDPITGTVVDRVMTNPPGQPQPVPNMQVYTMEPGRPGRELQQGLDTYNEYVRQAQIYAEYGQTGKYAEMVTKAKEMENSLFYLQGAQALQELAFNSPQRMAMVLSEQFGREIGLQPNQTGGWDVYADGMLAMQMSKPELSSWARMQIDDTFAAAEAQRAATYAEEQMKSDIQQNREIAVAGARGQIDQMSEVLKADLSMQKALFDAQVNPSAVELTPAPDGAGDIYVYDKVARALLGVITTNDYANPGQSLPAPTFIPTSQ